MQKKNSVISVWYPNSEKKPNAHPQCELQNHAGQDQYVTLDSQNSFHGYGDPPKSIQDQQSGNFKHHADSKGSIGGVAYLLETKLKWIIAWSNAEEEPNKVYTQILNDTEAIDWAQIKANLGISGNQSSDKNKF